VRYNGVLDIDDITDASDVGDEPITKQEVKDYLRVEGFTDLGESTSESLSDFDYDDDLIDDTITAVREMFEARLGIHIVPKRLRVLFNNGKGMQEMPGPMIGDFITLKDEDGEDIDEDLIKLLGSKKKFLKEPTCQMMTAIYEAGLTSVPKAIKHDLIRAAAYYYMNRGDKESHLFINQLTNNISRNVWL
jgi:hypothetical protein